MHIHHINNTKLMSKFKFLIVPLIALLQACSVNTDTTYYKDTSTSLESHMTIDKSMSGMMNLVGDSPAGAASAELKKLTTEWKSLYDIQKDGLVNLHSDSAKVLKKLFMKVSKDDGNITGISVKYDKLMPGEVRQLISKSRQLQSIPFQNASRWDGNTLTIDTEKLNMGSFISQMEKAETTEKPATKQDSITAYGKQMASGMIGMLRMFDMKMTSTLKFQRPIKHITGQHDYVKQVDKNTVKISLSSKQMLDEEKRLTHQDPKIIITTE